MKKILLLFMMGCASITPDFKQEEVIAGKSQIVFYWPSQWQSQWGRYIISINGEDKIVLRNEGYFSIRVDVGRIDISSRHFQNKDFILNTKLHAKSKKQYFLKLDTQPKEVTLMSAMGDITSVGTVISGLKSHQKLKEGRGSYKDASNYIKAEQLKLEMEHKKTKPLGFHVLTQIENDVALLELETCCSSKKTDKIQKD